MESSIFYHEDFYRQVELVPQENYFSSHRDIIENSITDVTEYGFLKIRDRQEHKVKTLDLKIGLDSLKDTLQQFIILDFKTVTTGYSTSIRIKPHTVAFGFERIALFIELSNTDSIIQNIWMCQSTLLPNDIYSHNLLQALVALGNNYGLILVDWNEEIVVRLSSIQIVQNYLREVFSFQFPLNQ